MIEFRYRRPNIVIFSDSLLDFRMGVSYKIVLRDGVVSYQSPQRNTFDDAPESLFVFGCDIAPYRAKRGLRAV